MTIDEAIAHEKELAKEIYVEAMLCHANPDDGKLDDCIERGKYHEQLAEWLEELKAIKDGGIPIIHGQEELKLHDREIRNKAVDDFANRLYLKIKSEIDHCADELEWIGEIAKRLKAGDCD